MRYLFYLSGDDVELAEKEVLRLAETYGKVHCWDRDGYYLIVDYNGEEFFWRLAYTHEVSILCFSLDCSELEMAFRELNIPRGKGCVRVVGKVSQKSELERKLGSILWKRGAEISVSRPSWVYRVYFGNKCHVGLLRWVRDKKQFLLRRPDYRPFLVPSAIKPKFARALVNLSGVRSSILDPMCGTGSVLIEAGLMGIFPVGVEFFSKIAHGCMRNLRFYSIKGEVLVGDARRLPFKDESFDGIVTDYPYLRSTKSAGRLEELYEESAREIWRVLRRGCYAVIVTNIDAGKYFESFTIELSLQQRVHGSLTRKIYLLRRER